MPVLSRFYGIIIVMYWRDHPPPHFHAMYGGHEVVVEIRSGRRIGSMPRRALSMIEMWRWRHQADLLRAWNQAEANMPVDTIVPLE